MLYVEQMYKKNRHLKMIPVLCIIVHSRTIFQQKENKQAAG